MKSRLEIVPVSVTNALKVLEITEQYKDLLNFEATCFALSRRVARAVCYSWKSSADVLDFWSLNKSKIELINVLFEKCSLLAVEGIFNNKVLNRNTTSGLLFPNNQTQNTTTGFSFSSHQAPNTTSGLLFSNNQAQNTTTGFSLSSYQAPNTTSGLLFSNNQAINTTTGFSLSSYQAPRIRNFKLVETFFHKLINL